MMPDTLLKINYFFFAILFNNPCAGKALQHLATNLYAISVISTTL